MSCKINHILKIDHNASSELNSTHLINNNNQIIEKSQKKTDIFWFPENFQYKYHTYKITTLYRYICDINKI